MVLRAALHTQTALEGGTPAHSQTSPGKGILTGQLGQVPFSLGMMVRENGFNLFLQTYLPYTGAHTDLAWKKLLVQGSNRLGIRETKQLAAALSGPNWIIPFAIHSPTKKQSQQQTLQ